MIPIMTYCNHVLNHTNHILLLSFVVTDPDTMSLKESLEQDDRFKVLAAMNKELIDHISRRYLKVVPRKLFHHTNMYPHGLVNEKET